METALWFPGRGELFAGEVAKAICRSCPVRCECLADALAVELDVDGCHAIRGGLSADQRRQLRAGVQWRGHRNGRR